MGQEHYLLIFQSFPKYQTSLEFKGLIGLSFRMRWICVFFLSSQLRSSSGLKTIDNGVGPIIWGAEEKVVDYAVLADDETAALPSQVTTFSVFNFCFFSSSVYNLFLNNVGGFDNQPLFFPTPTRIRETLDDAGLSLGWLPRSTLVQNYGEVKFRFQILKSYL